MFNYAPVYPVKKMSSKDNPNYKEKYNGFMNSLTEDLLEFYIANDEDVMLIGNGFETSIKLSLIKHNVPVMKTALETKINEDERDTRKTKVIQLEAEFEEETVVLFVNILQQRKALDDELEWNDVVKLLKFSHFYQAGNVFEFCYTFGRYLASDHIYDAILLMELHDFDAWDEECGKVVMMRRNNLMETEEWETLLDKCPKTVARVLNNLIKRNTNPMIWATQR